MKKIVLFLNVAILTLIVVALLIVACPILERRLPIIYESCGAGVLYADDAVGVYSKMASEYIADYSLDVPAPKSTDEAIFTLDENGTYRCFVYSPFHSGNVIYQTTTGETVEYYDGWLIMPNGQIYQLKTDEEEDIVLPAIMELSGERKPIGVFYDISWEEDAVSAPVRPLSRQKWLVRTILFLHSHLRPSNMPITVINVFLIVGIIHIAYSAVGFAIYRKKGHREASSN